MPEHTRQEMIRTWPEQCLDALALPYANRVMAEALRVGSVEPETMRAQFGFFTDGEWQIVRRGCNALCRCNLLTKMQSYPTALYEPNRDLYQEFAEWIRCEMLPGKDSV